VPEPDEAVVFIAHFQRNFRLPVSQFVHDFLENFNLNVLDALAEGVNTRVLILLVVSAIAPAIGNTAHHPDIGHVAGIVVE
jgi:hypothetical protein